MKRLLHRSGGIIPHQVSLLALFKKWLSNNHLEWAATDAEDAAYRLRRNLMVLGRVASHPGRSVPKKFAASLNPVVALFKAQAAASASDSSETRGLASSCSDDADEADRLERPVLDTPSVAPVPPPILDVPACSDSDDTSSFCEIVSRPAGGHDVDSVLDCLEKSLLFRRVRVRDKTKTECSLVAVTTPPKKMHRPAVDDSELDSLYQDALQCSDRAPTPQEYKVAFKKQKATTKADVSPAQPQPSLDGFSLDALVKPYLGQEVSPASRKRVYSATWHRVRSVGTRQGLSDADAKAMVSLKGTVAVSRFIELAGLDVE